MGDRSRRILNMALQANNDGPVETSQSNQDSLSVQSSPAPSVDQELMDIINDDISDDDRTYIPDEDCIRSNCQSAMSSESLNDNSNSTPIQIIDSNNGTPTATSKPYARTARKERKDCLHTGREYTTSKGKRVAARKIKELKSCRNKCHLDLTPEIQKDLFEEYWTLASYEKRVAYIAGLINTEPKKTMRVRETEKRSREFTHKYYFEINGVRKLVCKTCFCATLDEKPRFIRTVINKKKTSVSGITKMDGRGKKAPPHKKTQLELNDVQSHILSFPSYESHYTRRTNDKKYLSSDLNLRIMYELYCQGREKPVGRKIYEKTFHSLKLSFKKPQQDTCHKCDTLKMKIKVAECDDDMNRAKEELHAHHLSADSAYEMKKCDKEMSKVNKEKACFTFDLQQCLPTPFLASSVVFYKRQLWTFNLTIHNGDTGVSTNYMWHEALANRGGNEIASCLYHFLKHKLPNNVTEVTFYSDTCGGQNKNSHVSAMFLKVIEESDNLKIINHKFLVPGHTHMECDIDHALIEKQKKRNPTGIYHPHDWYQLVRSTGKKKQFEVYEMKIEDFYEFSSLLSDQLVAKKKNEEGINFKWHDVKWLQYNSESPRKIKYKNVLDQNGFKTVNFRRRGKASILSVPHRYNSPVPISIKKKQDLLSLLTLIPPVFHDFYKLLTTSNNTVDEDPDLREMNEDN